MNVLIFGATGMLGHTLMHSMSKSFTVFGTIRRKENDFSNHPLLEGMNLIGNTYAEDENSIESAINTADPDVLINCIGIIKQPSEAKDPIKSITINSLFPHTCQTLPRKGNSPYSYEYGLRFFRGEGELF